MSGGCLLRRDSYKVAARSCFTQLILIGGGVSAQQKLLIEPIAEKVKASVMPAFAEGLEIRAAQLHNDAGMVGAVYYFRQTMEKE